MIKETPRQTDDPVNHPSHYNWLPHIEALDVMEHFNFNLGSVIKYVWRAGHKPNNPELVDLRKAEFYLKREIDRLEKQDGKIRD